MKRWLLVVPLWRWPRHPGWSGRGLERVSPDIEAL